MRINMFRVRRADHSFGKGLIDFLVYRHIKLRGKILKIESLSQKTRVWGLEPNLCGPARLSALIAAVEACPFLALARVGRETGVAFAFDAKDPFPLLQMLLQSTHGSFELETPSMRLYVRHGSRTLGGIEVPCLDIAKVSVSPRRRKKGIFTRLIEQMEQTIEMAIYVENIQNPILVPFFSKRGYTLQDPEALLPCYYRLYEPSRR